MQRQLDGHKTELERMRDELEKKGQLLSADARREKQDALERKVRDVRRLVDDLQAQLQKKEDALLQKVLQDVAGLIQRLGKEKGYAVVLERQRAGVLYASGDSDLTEDVLNGHQSVFEHDRRRRTAIESEFLLFAARNDPGAALAF